MFTIAKWNEDLTELLYLIGLFNTAEEAFRYQSDNFPKEDHNTTVIQIKNKYTKEY